MSQPPFGIRYKKHMVYCDRMVGETTNSFIKRLWFVTKNITKVPYDELVMYSKYYANIEHKGMKYDESIHRTIEEMSRTHTTFG